MVLLLAIAAANPPSSTAGAEQPAPDLSGTWKMTLTVTTAAHVPVLGDTLVVSERVNLVRIVEQDGQVLQHHKPCTVEAESQQLIAQTTIPDAFVRSLPSKTYPVELSWNGEQWVYSVDLQPEQMGFVGDVLPSSSTDEHVLDTDHDGQPGVTVSLDVPVFGEVDAYLVQKAHTSLKGGMTPEGGVAGSADVMVYEQNVIGATNRLFAHQPTVVPVEGVSTFTLERVPEGSSCKDL